MASQENGTAAESVYTALLNKFEADQQNVFRAVKERLPELVEEAIELVLSVKPQAAQDMEIAAREISKRFCDIAKDSKGNLVLSVQQCAESTLKQLQQSPPFEEQSPSYEGVSQYGTIYGMALRKFCQTISDDLAVQHLGWLESTHIRMLFHHSCHWEEDWEMDALAHRARLELEALYPELGQRRPILNTWVIQTLGMAVRMQNVRIRPGLVELVVDEWNKAVNGFEKQPDPEEHDIEADLLQQCIDKAEARTWTT